MTKTREMLADHLPECLADLAESYIMPKSSDRLDIVRSGHYELCMELKPQLCDVAEACYAGHEQIIKLWLEYAPVYLYTDNGWPDCREYMTGLAVWFSIACHDNNRALMTILRDHGALWCGCGNPIADHML